MTQHLNRRHLLALVAGGGVLTAAGCGAIATSAVVGTVAADVDDIATGLLGVLPVIGTIYEISPDMVAIIGAAIANLQNLAQQIKVTTDITSAQPLVQQVEANINVIVHALAGVQVLPAQVILALQAVAVLLPVIVASVHLMVPAKLTARAAQVRMTPEQARANLRSLAPRHA